jgi:hypothetical protein
VRCPGTAILRRQDAAARRAGAVSEAGNIPRPRPLAVNALPRNALTVVFAQARGRTTLIRANDTIQNDDAANSLLTVSRATLPLTISLFTTAFPDGPAFGVTECMAWGAFAALFRRRRQGRKDGPNFVPATFKLEHDGRVRRLKDNLLARTAVALDCETNKKTGEVPPPFAVAVARIERQGWAAIVYTSHNHTPMAPRYRVVLPLSEEIATNLPVVEVVADCLRLRGALDESKIGASSVFYFPSAAPGRLAHHESVVMDGLPINAAWVRDCSGALLAAREAEHSRQRAEALEAATRRREERINQGFDPSSSIIESIRDRLDLAGELVGHGYKRVGDKYLYPASQTGVAGVYILSGRDGVQRVYSHHAADPLAAGNLPSWCRAKAIDVVDVLTILDFGGAQKAALRSLALRFGIETPRSDPVPRPPTEDPGYAASLGVDAEIIPVSLPSRGRVAPDLRRNETIRTAFRLLRQGAASADLLAELHARNGRRSDPLPPGVVDEIALWAARCRKKQPHAQ